MEGVRCDSRETEHNCPADQTKVVAQCQASWSHDRGSTNFTAMLDRNILDTILSRVEIPQPYIYGYEVHSIHSSRPALAGTTSLQHRAETT